MTAIAAELEELIDKYSSLLTQVQEEEFNHKPLPTKWSNKELIGHLIDSAENNTRRFIVSQYEENPMIVYNQDKWVAINNYQQWISKDLVQLWNLLNKQMIIILKNIPDEVSQRNCNTGASYTIEWLATDYIKHLKHHMHQVLKLEPVLYP
jgi:hypothetical protein